MSNYRNAGQGLRYMFVSEIGAIICTILALIPLINILAVIGAIVLGILSIVGLYIAGKDLEGCRTAFWITIINLIFGILESLFRSSSLGSIFSLVEATLSLMVVYYVCMSVNGALSETGYHDVARTGNTVWKINLACFIVQIVITVLALIPFINVLAVISSFLVLIAKFVGGILYLIYLHGSYQALE